MQIIFGDFESAAAEGPDTARRMPSLSRLFPVRLRSASSSNRFVRCPRWFAGINRIA